jgi:hypothetical protein
MIECSILSELEDKTGWKAGKKTYSPCFHKSSSDDFPFQTVVTGEEKPSVGILLKEETDLP